MPAPPPDTRPAAFLLLGPTGSGKTPLGERLEAAGLGGRRCVHFDFGANLRRCAAEEGTERLLTEEERAFVRRTLETGALLEDRDFPLASKVLLDFLARRGAGPDTLVVLNGLPRHAGQAAMMEPLVRVELVVNLACEPETILERIRTNVAGDRTGRTDDTLDDIRRKLLTYTSRTTHLLAHYLTRGVRAVTIEVEATTTAEEMRQRLVTVE
jgi:adenylate kinase family enzyme